MISLPLRSWVSNRPLAVIRLANIAATKRPFTPWGKLTPLLIGPPNRTECENRKCRDDFLLAPSGGTILAMLANKASTTKLIVAAICGAFAVYFVWRAESSQVQGPSDAKLVQIFQVHRDQFERLCQMVTEDMRQTSYFSDSNISEVLPEPRRKEYKTLLGIYRGLAVGVD